MSGRCAIKFIEYGGMRSPLLSFGASVHMEARTIEGAALTGPDQQTICQRKPGGYQSPLSNENGELRPMVSAALEKSARMRASDVSRPDPASREAGAILEDIYAMELRCRPDDLNGVTALLVILTVFSELLDSYIAAERRKPTGGSVKKNWKARRRRLIGDFPARDARKIRREAPKLIEEFRRSLGVSPQADALADELGAICLALVVEYPSRVEERSDFHEAKAALHHLVNAFAGAPKRLS